MYAVYRYAAQAKIPVALDNIAPFPPRSISESLPSSILVTGEPLTTRFHENPLRTSIMVEYPCIERSIHALSQLNAP